MATTIRTVKTYPLNGSTREFDIPFEYLARKFVTITLIGTDRKVLTLTTDYRFATKTRIQTTRAWGPADGYDMIEIRRFTSATERLVDFTDGSILRAYDMNISLVQTLHVAEEARDLTADTIGVNNDGNLDARGRRIVNLADAVDPGDAVTLRQNQQWAGSALNSMNAAKVSETNAKNSENRSVQAETRSVQAETRSVQAETNSKNSEDMAQKWAANPLGVIVAQNMYSSFHYANQANTSAGLAKTSENNAKTSETAAAGSAVTAKNEADRAASEANKLGSFNEFGSALSGTKNEGFTLASNWYVGFNGTYGGRLDVADIVAAGRMSTTGNATFNGITTMNGQTNMKNGYSNGQFDANGYRVRGGGGNPGNGQGSYMLWNEFGAGDRSGAASFVNNHGTGNGGFVWRDVNASNSIQRCEMWLRPDGRLTLTQNEFGNQQMVLGPAGHGMEWITAVVVNGADKYLQFSIDGSGRGINFFDSDATLKHDIKDTKPGDSLKLLDKIRPRTFKWNDNGKQQDFGVIAQELKEVFPDAISQPENSDGTLSTMQLNPSVLITYLLNVVKDLKLEVDALKE